jgi:hypothetical protein
MKKINSLIKVVSVTVIVSLCASLVTACNQKDDRTDFTTRETETQFQPGVDEPNQTINTVDPTETATPTESTPAPAGKYTYTVYAGTEYETTLSMDVNIDDYLLNKDDQKVPFFSIGSLKETLGYLNNGDPNFDSSKETLLYSAYIYGDTQMVWRSGDNYSDTENPSGYPQMYSFNYHLAPISNYKSDARTAEEIESSYSNYGIIVQFSQHSDDICYYTVNDGEKVGISRDDAIIIAYVLSSAIARPGENPFAGTNLDKTLALNSGNYLTYVLP